MTNAQKAALSASKTNYKSAQKTTKTSKKKYNTAYNNYSNKLNQEYKPSEKVQTYQQQSDNMLNAAKAMGDFSYDSQYTDKITGLLDKAENMKFDMNYSLTDDPAYQSYRDQYVHNGQLAAQEAMGNAVQQTGGYGSTAATTASQQAYNESLTQLNNIVPDLYGQAYEREWNKFTNERDVLQQLAAAYQSQDQLEYDQALNTWTNNFNQYITLANEYNSKYEYLDAAERASYETELQGLYNLLTVAQDQYQNDQNVEQNALGTYSDTTTDIANYEETVRANKAAEKQAAAELAEQIRANKAAEAYNNRALAAKQSSSSGSSSGSGSYSSSGNNNSSSSNQSMNIPNGAWQAVGMNRSDEGRVNAIQKLYEQGTINKTEANYMLEHYGLK